ncbi:unnamed protein product, partial [Cuscuta campestris]
MEALFLSVSSSSIVRRSNSCFLIRKHDVCRMQSAALRVRNMVHSQGGSGNNVVKSSNISYVVTERSATLEQGSKAALMESTAGSLILAPNGNVQTDVGMKDLVPYDGGSSSTALVEKHDDGIGIVKFLRGKSFLITGGTGFLGKVLIEKILRTVPDVHKIFILIKADNKEVAMERLKNEIVNAELFKFLKQTYGNSYQAFMLNKLVPVVGNVCESGLGMDEHAAESIAMEVDIIINSAANTTFDERYDVALDINTNGTNRLVKFATQCQKLKLFLHVSTAYVNGQRQGRIMERPFCIGDSIAGERAGNGIHQNSIPKLNVEDEMKMVLGVKETLQESEM